MVSALVPGASGPGSSPGSGHCVVFLGKTLTVTLTVSLSTQEYNWVPANCWGEPNKLWGDDLRWTWNKYSSHIVLIPIIELAALDGGLRK